jgi:hypothetical protein
MVSAVNTRLRIAREMLPKAGGTDPVRARWGPRAPAGAHMAVAEQAPMAAAAAPLGAPGGSGACHNCGEVGHYKNGCPYPRRNSSGGNHGGRGQGGGGGRGWEKSPRACFVCGDLSHVASQCAKRVVPAASAAVPAGTGGGMRSVGASEFQAFEEWRAITAAVATEEDSSREDEGDWDDQDYALGAVALPLEGPEKGVQVAAARTKGGAEKARAMRAVSKRKDKSGPRGTGVTRRAGGVGTALIAKPVDEAATSALRRRRDKAAAKERLVKLPDHGRHVAPQGLNRLPAGFPIRTIGSQTLGVPADGGQVHRAPGSGVIGRRPVVTQLPASPLQRPVQRVSPRVGTGVGPSLTGSVQIEVGVLLNIALSAGMDLAAVLALTGAMGAGKREEATLAALEQCAPRALAQRAGAMMGLSPVARHAQTGAAQSGAAHPIPREPVGMDKAPAPGAVAVDQMPEAVDQVVAGQQLGGLPSVESSRPRRTGPAETSGVRVVKRGRFGSLPAARGVCGGQSVTKASTYREAAARSDSFDPESSATGAARGGHKEMGAGDAALARQIAQRDAAEREELVVATSGDAELAMLMVAEEARERGVDREVALRAQGGAADSSLGSEGAGNSRGKGKDKV